MLGDEKRALLSIRSRKHRVHPVEQTVGTGDLAASVGCIVRHLACDLVHRRGHSESWDTAEVAECQPAAIG